jgi:hypothetical protein
MGERKSGEHKNGSRQVNSTQRPNEYMHVDIRTCSRLRTLKIEEIKENE